MLILQFNKGHSSDNIKRLIDFYDNSQKDIDSLWTNLGNHFWANRLPKYTQSTIFSMARAANLSNNTRDKISVIEKIVPMDQNQTKT